jgi:hypothetical protein
MLIEFAYRFNEIPVKRHGRLRNLEGSEQPGGVAVIRQSPPQGRSHPVGMKGAHRVTFTGTQRDHEIVQPHGPVVVIE